MISTKKGFLISMFFLLSCNLMAQDAFFSQFQYNPINVNPALSGTGKNNLRLSFNSKIQWMNLYKPYKYFTGSADFSIYDYYQRNVLNMALNVNHSSKGYLNNTKISGVVGRSFGTNTTNCSNWFLSLALEAGVNIANVNPDQYLFADQIDQNGITGNATSVELFNNYNTNTYFDFGSGAIFALGDFMAGVSVQHLNEPSVSFVGSAYDSKMPKKTTLHLSYLYESEVIKLKPTIITSIQGNSSMITLGTLFDYNEFPIEFGCWYRNTLSFSSNSSFSVGFTWKWGESTTVTSRTKEYSTRIGYTYDADITKPSINTSYGSMELGIQKDLIINDNRYCPTSNSGICGYRFPWEFF